MHNEYFKRLSRGGLKVPLPSLADFTCDSFDILDFTETEFEKNILLQEKQRQFPYIYIRIHQRETLHVKHI